MVWLGRSPWPLGERVWQIGMMVRMLSRVTVVFVPGVLAMGSAARVNAMTSADVTGTVASHSLQARQDLLGADGTPLAGTGVSVAVIDTGVDPTHPLFQMPDGMTKVVGSLSSTGCVNVPLTDSSCVHEVGPSVDTDGITGGHGSQKLEAIRNLTASSLTTHLGIPSIRPSVGRSNSVS